MITKYDVIRKPFLTEKAMHTDATKTQIKEAVEDLLKVKVEHVRTMNFKGKEKRFGKILGRRNDWKKAIVTLKEGEKLDIV